MIKARFSTLTTKTWCVATALILCGAGQHAAFAQTAPETHAATAQKQPGGAQQPAAQQPATPQPVGQQPAAQQPATLQPVRAKPEMGPPDPSRLVLDPAKMITPGQPAAIPAPTVQLKPGEVPVIEFDVADYNFGRIPAGQQVSHEFWFTNTGNGPLEILSVKPSCGCTVAGEYDRIVQPGESGKIPVKLNVGTHGGKQNKAITVTTNAPGDAASVKLSLQGEVWVALEANPANAAFGRLTAEAAKEPPPQKLIITSNVEDAVELTNVHSTNAVFHPEVSVIEPGKKFELTVTLASSLQSGNNAGAIEMSTGLKDMPTLSVPVNAFLAPDVEVMPSALSLPADIAAATTRQLYVRNNAKAPMQLSGVETSNPALKATLEETRAGMEYRLMIEIPAGYQPPSGSDKITFKTNSPTLPLVTVPVNQMKAGAAPPAVIRAPVGDAAPAKIPIQPNVGQPPAGQGASGSPAPAVGAGAVGGAAH